MLTEIKQLQDEIQRNKSKKVQQNVERCRFDNTELNVQNYQQIAKNWEDTRNNSKAIETYKALIKDFPDKNSAVAGALFSAASLYQQNAQYEKAIQTYDNLFNKYAESTWHTEAVYQRSIWLRIFGVSE